MLLQREKPVNFTEVVLDLIRWGWNLTRISEAINVGYSTVASWLYTPGTIPNYENGRALLALHAVVKKNNSATNRRDASAHNPLRARSI